MVLVWKSSQYLQTHICASIPKCWYYGRFYLPTRSFFFIGPNFMDEWTKRLFSLRPTTYLTGIHNRYIKSFFTRMIHFTVKYYDLKWFFYKFQHPSRSFIVDIITNTRRVWFGLVLRVLDSEIQWWDISFFRDLVLYPEGSWTPFNQTVGAPDCLG